MKSRDHDLSRLDFVVPPAWVELLLVFIGVVSLAAIGLLSIARFNPTRALGISVLATLGYSLSFKRQFARVDRGLAAWTVLAFVVGLGFRIPPFPHQVGGQDQGLYVSMAQDMLSQRQITEFTDVFRESLDARQRLLYDQNSGSESPGVQWLERSNSRLELPFYPLHPALMAITSEALGKFRQGWSHVLLGALVVPAFFWLGFALSGRRHTGVLAAGLAALHPGFAFFSKFPTTEMVALFFSCWGYLYFFLGTRALLRGLGGAWRLLFVSMLLFNCFFYTRMTFPIHMPALVIVMLLCFSALKGTRARAGFLAWCLGLAATFVLSWVAYSRILPLLYASGSSGVLEKIGATQDQQIWRLGCGALALAIVFAFEAKFSLLRRLLREHERWFGVVARLVLAVGLLALISHSWTLYAGGIADDRVKAEAPGVFALTRDIGYRVLLYLGPVGGIVLVWFGVVRRPANLTTQAVVFITGVHLGIVVMVGYVLYSFYGDRYLLTEAVPAGLLVVAMAFGEAWSHPNKRLVIACRVAAGLNLAYFGAFSLMQVGRIEGSYASYFERIDRLPRESVVLMEQDVMHRGMAIKTALQHFHHLNVFPVRGDDLAKPEVLDLVRRYPGRTFLLTASTFGGTATLKPDDGPEPLRYEEGFFVSGVHAWVGHPNVTALDGFLIPYKYQEQSQDQFLYQLRPR